MMRRPTPTAVDHPGDNWHSGKAQQTTSRQPIEYKIDWPRKIALINGLIRARVGWRLTLFCAIRQRWFTCSTTPSTHWRY